MLSLERKQEIESIVNGFIEENELNTPGFDLIKFLTQNCGFAIGIQPFEKNTTGVLLLDDDNFIPNTDTHKLISVNTDLGVDDEYIYNLKKRFIVAHEFAHYKLHKKDNIQYAHRDTDQKDTLEEEEADFFARCLLMPRKLVSDVLSVDGIKKQTLCEKAVAISRLFFVTKNKAKIRIEELELA